MSLLKSVIREMATGGATGAGAIAGAHGSLFAGGYISSSRKRKKRKNVMFSRLGGTVHNRISESLGIDTDKTRFNAADVISKLDAAEKKANNQEDTTAFGLEDERGNLVKVYVRSDQAQEFERALAALLGGADDNADDMNSSLEIAEVLFELKDKFDIIDVDWGRISADEEEEQKLEGDEEGLDDEGGDMEAAEQEDPGLEGDDLGGMDDMSGGDDDVKGLLQQVIDVLKSQADAQKAEANARAAEAKAKEAEFAAKAAASKVKQEEEILDMEAYYKKQADEKKEAKQLAKLARYKHEQAKEAQDLLKPDQYFNANLGASEEQEEHAVVSPRELAAAIFRELKK